MFSSWCDERRRSRRKKQNNTKNPKTSCVTRVYVHRVIYQRDPIVPGAICSEIMQQINNFITSLFSLQLGILDMDLLLGYSENENISGWRESVICELGQYIANTGRLFSKF